MAHLIILVRHGDIPDEFRARFVGRMNPPLSEEGRRNVLALKPRVNEICPDIFLSSPKKRAIETAGILSEALLVSPKGNSERIGPILDEDLSEIDFGEWEGLTFEEIKLRDPERVDLWARYDKDFSFPRGEGLSSFHKRILLIASRFAKAPEETILAVTHAGVIRALICQFLGLPFSQSLGFKTDRASITTLEIENGHGVLKELNWRPFEQEARDG